jgi:thiosulfate dehydrogenase
LRLNLNIKEVAMGRFLWTRRFVGGVVGVVVCISLAAVLAGPAAGEGKGEEALKLGGLLYDNWPKVTGTKPEGTHPLYPASGKKRGLASWRCKECHGWDYLGDEGRYRSGSHYTGIEGILGEAGESREEILEALRGGEEGHDFSPWLSDVELEALALFIEKGLVDTRKAITAEGSVHGDKMKGGRLYGRHCGDCHGTEGGKLDFKAKKEGVQGVGWLARENPQEVLHKIRWGHPGSDMPSALVDDGLSDKETVDILKYTQKLHDR